MSLARLIPISYANRNSAKAHEIILDYDQGYMYFKNVIGDILPVKTAGYDRSFSILNFNSKLFKSGYTNPDVRYGNYYAGTGATTIGNYYNGAYRLIRPDISETDAVTYYDEDTGGNSYSGGNNFGVIGKLSKQLLNGYIQDENHIHSTNVAMMVRDQKRNVSLGLPNDAITAVFPLTIANNVLFQSYVPGVGVKLNALSDMLTVMQSDIDSRFLASEISKYLPKGSGWATADTTSYPDLKAIITAIANRYTKSESDAKYLPYGAAAFLTDAKYAGLRDAKSIADYMLDVNTNMGSKYMPYAANDTELATYKSTAPYNNYLTMKSLIDQLVFKGAGWNGNVAPYNTYTTMKSIVDAIVDRYTKTETDNTFASKAATFLKGTTAAEINEYNNNNKYKTFVTAKHLIDAILDRYAKAEADVIFDRKLSLGATEEDIATFKSDSKYTGYRNAKDIVDKLQGEYGLKGGSLAEAYNTMKKLGDKIQALETSLLSAGTPIDIKCVGIGYGTVFGYIDNLGFYRNSPDDGILNEILLTSCMRGSILNKGDEDRFIVPIKARRHFGGKTLMLQRRIEKDFAEEAAADNPNLTYSDSVYKVPSFNAVTYQHSTNNDIKVFAEFSDTDSGHYPVFVDLDSRGSDSIAVDIITNKQSKFAHFLSYQRSTNKMQLSRKALNRPEAEALLAVPTLTPAEIDPTHFINSGKEDFVLGDYGISFDSSPSYFFQTMITYNSLIIFKFAKYDNTVYDPVTFTYSSGVKPGNTHYDDTVYRTKYKVYQNGVLVGPKVYVKWSVVGSNITSIYNSGFTNANSEIEIAYSRESGGGEPAWFNGVDNTTVFYGAAFAEMLYPNDQVRNPTRISNAPMSLILYAFGVDGRLITGDASTSVRLKVTLPPYAEFTGNSGNSNGFSTTNVNPTPLVSNNIRVHTDGAYWFSWGGGYTGSNIVMAEPAVYSGVVPTFTPMSCFRRSFGASGEVIYAESFKGRVDGLIWTVAIKDGAQLLIRATSPSTYNPVKDYSFGSDVVSGSQLIYVSRMKNVAYSETEMFMSYYILATDGSIIRKDITIGLGTASVTHIGTVGKISKDISALHRTQDYILERDWDGDIIRIPKGFVHPQSGERGMKVFKITDEI